MKNISWWSILTRDPRQTRLGLEGFKQAERFDETVDLGAIGVRLGALAVR
ncbi:MAG: hypothetical protein AB4040_12420 [Synechococcus sp.]